MGDGEPEGVRLERVYLLLTDIEGSTGRWEHAPDTMRAALRAHDELVTSAIVEAGGEILKRTGDGAVGTFASAAQAVNAAATLQRMLTAVPELDGIPVRMGVHCGDLERRLGDLHGPEMNRAARIVGAAHGGQIVVSRDIRDQCADVAGFRRLGSHRLRGLLRPIELYQVVAPGLREDFPPPNGSAPEIGNLPLVPPAIVGRHDEIDAVVAAVGHGQLTTLTGPGGVGKTRLAVHVARLLRAEYAGGGWFVDLSTITEPAGVLTVIATSLGVAGGSVDRMLERVVDRCSGAPTLLVVDNCEHLGAAVADTVSAIVAAAPTATVLCTTQRLLGCPGERVIRLEPLPVDDAPGGGRAPAVELFHQRASRARDGEALAGFDESVERICRALDGLPLAIELAAARCAVTDPDELSARLGDSFALLRRRDGIVRHRTLDSVIGWSYDLLDDAEQRQLRALSVFHGPFDLAAAEAVSGRDAIEHVAELVDRSLVQRTGDGLSLLDSVHRFAAARCRQAGEHDELATRHARWVASLASTPIDGTDVDAVAQRLTRLRSHRSDIRAGIETLIDIDAHHAAMVVAGLVDYWVAHDIGGEPVDLLTRARPLITDPAVGLAADTTLACFGWIDGRNDLAEMAARRALDEAARHGLPFPAFAASRLAVQLALRGATDDARPLIERSLAAVHDDPERARIYGGLAVAIFIDGDTARAVEVAEAGVTAARDDGAIRLMSAISNRLIVTAGSAETASLADELAELAARLDRHSAAAQALMTKAHHARATGDHHGFLSTLAASVRTMYLCGQRTQMVSTLDYAAGALEDVGALHDAATMLGASARLRPEVGLPAASLVAGVPEVAERVRGRLGEAEYQRRFDAGNGLSMEATLELLDSLVAAHAATERRSA